jgi:phosphopantetheine--protein transferase-like protein
MTRQHLSDLFETELFLIGGDDETALIKELGRVQHLTEHAADISLQNLAYTCATRALKKPAIVAIVASTLQGLCERLTMTHKKLSDKAKRIRDKSGTYYFRERLYPRGHVAFLFPGVMSFYPNMLRDVNLAYDGCRAAFDELEESVEGNAEHFVPSDFIFPPALCYRSDTSAFAAEAFAESLIASHVANTALYRLLNALGIEPDGILGFSGGDLCAFEAAGVLGKLSRTKRLAFLRESYEMLTHLSQREDLPQCLMFAVMDATRDLLESLIAAYPGRIEIAAYYSPRQQVIAVSPEIEKEVLAALHAANAKTMTIPMVRPFNTPWCAKVLPTIQQFLSHWIRHAPKIPIYSCTTATCMPPRPRDILQQSGDQWNGPILLEETIRKMHADGYRIFIEVGVRGNLTTAVSEILKGQDHQAVALNRIHRSGITQLNHALGLLAAQGLPMDLTVLHRNRNSRLIDFSNPALYAPPPRLQRLSSDYPTLTAFSLELDTAPATVPKAPVDTIRKNLPDIGERKHLSFGADFPLLANGDIVEEQPGILVEISKILTLAEYPFLADYSIGTHQLSFADRSLKGLSILSLSSGLEIMAEAARKLVPRTRVAEVDHLRTQHWVGFERDHICVNVRAERIAWSDSRYTAVKVQLRDNAPNSSYTWPMMEATILLTSATNATLPPAQPPPLPNPRQVNWSGQEIYPERLFHGERLRLIRHVDLWSEGGIDFEIEVPKRANAVTYTRMPLFSVWPMLLDGIASSFSLWRSHEKFPGAVSLPFRARRILFHASILTEGARLRGYFRLNSVTPRSHVADIQISDGNGNLLIEVKGWEEICERRVPKEYHKYILKPAERFLSQELPLALLGNPVSPVATAVITDMPIKIMEANQELWLKVLAHVLLSKPEREEWMDMQGSALRRGEWLFGRASAKEAVRRYLQKYQLSHWTSADIQIWADDAGKPNAIGPWRDVLRAANLDISIAHTSKLIVAAAAANTRIGIDIEAVGRDLSEDFTNGVFTPEEMELAANLRESPTAMLKFWCAKEAISKALGTGIRYSPQDLHIVSADEEKGCVHIELLGQWLDLFKQFKGRKNIVYTSVYAGHAFASCLFSNTLFGN